jgi:hypothetical protein
LNYPASASPIADLPVPEPPYNKIPLESFIGRLLINKAVFIGPLNNCSNRGLCLLIPASLEKLATLYYPQN